MGIFGNPDVNYGKDWRQVVYQIEGLSQAGTFDLEKRQCTLTSTVHIELLTSQVGLINQLQEYIVGVKVQGVENIWTYSREIE